MKSLNELEQIKNGAKKAVNLRNNIIKKRIVVRMDSCGIAAGARLVMHSFLDEINKHNLIEVALIQKGCDGRCSLEPIVEVYLENQDQVTYVKVTPDMAKRIVSEHVIEGQPIKEYTL